MKVLGAIVALFLSTSLFAATDVYKLHYGEVDGSVSSASFGASGNEAYIVFSTDSDDPENTFGGEAHYLTDRRLVRSRDKVYFRGRSGTTLCAERWLGFLWIRKSSCQIFVRRDWDDVTIELRIHR